MTTELKAGKRAVYLTGKVKLRDNSFRIDQKSTSGYVYSSVNFGVETEEGNIVYVELMGGFGAVPLPIKTKTKQNGDMDVNWQDRHNSKVIEQVADYKLLKLSLKENAVESYLAQYDFVNALQGQLVDGMEVNVRGNIKHSVYKGEDQRRIEITGISLPYQKKDDNNELLPVEYHASFGQTILIDEHSLDITPQDEELGETILQAYAVDYIGKYDGDEIKANVLFPFALTVPLAGKGVAVAEKLFTVEAGKVTEITVDGKVIEGYEKTGGGNTDEMDIPDDIQELIDLGIYSLEDVKKKVQVRGNKVSKMLFTRPNVVRSEDGVISIQQDLDKYTPEDLVFYEQAINGEMPDNSDDGDSGDGSGESNDAWLNALGID